MGWCLLLSPQQLHPRLIPSTTSSWGCAWSCHHLHSGAERLRKVLEAPRILTTKATCARVLHLLHQLGWASSRAGQGLCAGVSEGRAGGSPAGGRDSRLSWRLPMSSQQRGQSPGLCWAPLLSSWLCPEQDGGRPWLGSDAALPSPRHRGARRRRPREMRLSSSLE